MAKGKNKSSTSGQQGGTKENKGGGEQEQKGLTITPRPPKPKKG